MMTLGQRIAAPFCLVYQTKHKKDRQKIITNCFIGSAVECTVSWFNVIVMAIKNAREVRKFLLTPNHRVCICCNL